MRSEKEMISLIKSIAEIDSRIRAVILNGSRTNKNIIKDDFQDYDIIYLVKELKTFKSDPNWIDKFGNRIIFQKPNTMNLNGSDSELIIDEIAYLMLFEDYNRIDLTLIETVNKNKCKNSLNKIILDKDNMFDQFYEPTDSDYWIKKPSQKEYEDCCNEFWWVSTYVVKGLAREELIYAKDMLENPIRKMFLKMIGWNIGVVYDFKINLGKSHKFLNRYVDSELWIEILKTYPSLNKENIWNSLLKMTELFNKSSIELSNKLDLIYNLEEANNLKEYLRNMEKRIIK